MPGARPTKSNADLAETIERAKLMVTETRELIDHSKRIIRLLSPVK